MGKYAIEFMKNAKPSIHVLERVKLFHTDSVMCGLSALALKTNAPSILKDEAMTFKKAQKIIKPKLGYSRTFGSNDLVPCEKAICSNASAVREWDSNGTVFGYNPNIPGH